MNRISQFYKLIIVFVGIAMLLFVFSCSSREDGDVEALDKEINTELTKISVNLALIDTMTPIYADYYCKMASLSADTLKTIKNSDQHEIKP